MSISIGLGAGIPFGSFIGIGVGSSSPVSELTALVKSLNGHIFVPGTETYADRLNITGAESALDSQVGYVGNAAGENYAYQDTLADTPILRAGRLLEFDGSTDHLVTSIVPASSGYVVAVFKQNSQAATATLIGCAQAVQGMSLRIVAGNLQLARTDAGLATASTTCSATIPLDTLVIADADWGISSARVRQNGANQVTGSATRDVAGSGILTIAAQNSAPSGAISVINFLSGFIGVLGYIPGTVPDATQARIRQLAGQIYGVTTA